VPKREVCAGRLAFFKFIHLHFVSGGVLLPHTWNVSTNAVPIRHLHRRTWTSRMCILRCGAVWPRWLHNGELHRPLQRWVFLSVWRPRKQPFCQPLPRRHILICWCLSVPALSGRAIWELLRHGRLDVHSRMRSPGWEFLSPRVCVQRRCVALSTRHALERHHWSMQLLSAQRPVLPGGQRQFHAVSGCELQQRDRVLQPCWFLPLP
jgi:hypothetical protein